MLIPLTATAATAQRSAAIAPHTQAIAPMPAAAQETLAKTHSLLQFHLEQVIRLQLSTLENAFFATMQSAKALAAVRNVDNLQDFYRVHQTTLHTLNLLAHDHTSSLLKLNQTLRKDYVKLVQDSFEALTPLASNDEYLNCQAA